VRGHDHRATTADYQVVQKKKKRLAVYDKLLKGFQYYDALDAVFSGSARCVHPLEEQWHTSLFHWKSIGAFPYAIGRALRLFPIPLQHCHTSLFQWNSTTARPYSVAPSQRKAQALL
jgi:hypothetical protein